MRDKIIARARRATSAFASFSAGQKAVTIVAVIALAVGGYFFATWATTPSYAPLFSNLAPTDAAAIVDKLAADGTPYQLTNGGATIMVPKEQVYDLRLKMSGQGLPADSDGAGYSLLDKQNVMTSEFMQQVGYRRAMEGELAKTVKSIDGVKAATVHLAIPEKDVFSDTQQKPTASVLVATKPGKSLAPNQVQAVVHLVASSVEGLDPDNVTVVGADGTVLSSGDVNAGTAGTAGDQRNRATREFEQRVNTSLQRMLDQVVGPGNAVVQVTADLNFDTTETKTQKYVADPNTPPLSESTKTEKYTGGTSTGGVLGPDNIQVPGGVGAGGSYEGSTETRNNAVGVVEQTVKSAPGAVRRMSVAVLVNSASVEGLNEAQLQQLVSSAVGLDAQRGDSIAVSAMKFDSSGAEATAKELAEAEKADETERMYSMIKTGATVGGVVLLLLFALISSRRRKKKLTRLLKAEVSRFEEEQAALKATAQPALESAEQAPALESAPASGPDDETLERDRRQREIAALVEQQPEDVANLLRGWLADRRA